MKFMRKTGVLVAVAACLVTAAAKSVDLAALTQYEPDQATIMLIKMLTPEIVRVIPNSLIANDKPVEVAKARKEQLGQMILAGVNLYELSLALKSGELSADFKEKLSAIRDQFRGLNAKLAAKNKELMAVSATFKTASADQRSMLMEKQALLMLEMSEIMANPLYNVSVIFSDLNTLVLSKLMGALEAIPPVKPYLMIGKQGDDVPLSGFMKGKFAEMVAYTDAQRKIGSNLKIVLEQLRANIAACEKARAAIITQDATELEIPEQDVSQTE